MLTCALLAAAGEFFVIVLRLPESHAWRNTGDRVLPCLFSINKVLTMAAMTYVAAAAQSLAVLVFFVFVLIRQGQKKKTEQPR